MTDAITRLIHARDRLREAQDELRRTRVGGWPQGSVRLWSAEQLVGYCLNDLWEVQIEATAVLLDTLGVVDQGVINAITRKAIRRCRK